jgi:hypothetical protein
MMINRSDHAAVALSPSPITALLSTRRGASRSAMPGPCWR